MGAKFSFVARLKRADEEGRLAPAIVLSLTVAALIPAFLHALAALERAPVPVRLKVFLEGFPEHLTVNISVYNLTQKGAVGDARASVRGPSPPEGLTFDFTVHKTPIGWVGRDRVERILYKIYPLNVFAYAYVPERRELHVASTYVTVSPERYEYVIELKAKRVHSRRVSGDQVPSPGQYAQFLDRHATNVVIVACSVPPGASCYVSIPQDANIPIETFEKMYWTDDPTLQTWTEEDWEATGYVSYTVDSSRTGRFSAALLYYFPTNVDYVMATVGEGPPPLYIVRILLYATNINYNTCSASDDWTPCSGGVFLTQFKRPETGTESWDKYAGFRVQVESFSASFTAIIGESIKVQVGGSFSLIFKIEPLTLRSRCRWRT